MMSSVGCDRRFSMWLEEVILERGRRLEGPLVLDVVADQIDRVLAEPRQVFLWQAEQFRDHPGRELQREVADQIGLACVDELVDQPVDDRPDDLGFPPQQRARLERRRHEIAVFPVGLALHRQDGRSDEQTDGGVVDVRVEHLAVAEDTVHRVERHRGIKVLGPKVFRGFRPVHDAAAEDAAGLSPPALEDRDRGHEGGRPLRRP